ncbi:hypothetical protein A1Q2_01041 [Trichosporon asahii var. asahii CBS 8904]|uniref:Uncharacterized protein n=1 Tax=Trichosporon asahii var. asahii (strain CBS 8904) TaxID=1220162 RepID=K1W714_TRIAC|nr:hypothetical protein A1Q2_01041 [Trichosporon asahii var. asahii CBS 8904]
MSVGVTRRTLRPSIPQISFEPTPDRPWRWTNASHSAALNVTPDRVEMEAPLGTDWLRSAPAPESWTEPEGLERRSAPAYMFPLQRNFRASVRIQGRWHGDWDQACIFLLEGRGEGDDNGQETHGSWIKVGVEHDAGYEFVGTVLTNPNSDWSCYPLPFETAAVGVDHSKSLLVVIEKLSDHVWIWIGTGDDDDEDASDEYMSDGEEPSIQGIRECKGFAVHTNEDSWWRLGVMTASPPGGAGKQGATGVFTDFRFEQVQTTEDS